MRLIVPLCLLMLAACSPSEKSPAPIDETPPAQSALPPAASIELPPAALAALRADFAQGAAEAHYFAQAVDLNDDGRDEFIAHVAGPMVCGTGGCNTVVLTPEGDKYRIVADISVTNPPIRVASSQSNGWRDLIVDVGGGGGPSGSVLLRFDGTGYPEDPSDKPAELLSAVPADARIVVAPFDSFDRGIPLYRPATVGER